MEYYGIQEEELEFFKSYLFERLQYVEVDTHRSRVEMLPPCGVIQGSILSCTLYTLYTNEVPVLHKIMKDENLFHQLTGETTNVNIKAEHDTYNYVDDSNSCVVFDNPEEIQEYIDAFFAVLKEFHMISKLKLNEEKTMLLITSQPKHREAYEDVVITEEGQDYIVKPKSQVKVLGFLINQRESNDA